MELGRLSPGLGLAVDTVLPNPSTRPGLALPGRVVLAAGAAEVLVDHVRLGLVTRVEPDGADDPPVLVEFHRMAVAGSFVLAAGERRTLPFAAALPWETPVTVVGGQPLLNLRMGLRTEVAVGPTLDRGDLRGLFVHPLPAQEGILAALDTLGFELRQAGMQAGRLPGVNQALPFHQKIGYWVGPLYGGPISELEVTFLADPAGVEVIFWINRRLALAGVGHVSISRFRASHPDGGDVDWADLVDRWVRASVDRHAAVASGTGLPAPGPATYRRPDPVDPGRGLYRNAGGESDGGDED